MLIGEEFSLVTSFLLTLSFSLNEVKISCQKISQSFAHKNIGLVFSYLAPGDSKRMSKKGKGAYSYREKRVKRHRNKIKNRG